MSFQYGWDVLNRMTSFTPAGGTTTDYAYRADGLRVSKANPVLGTSTSYAYDGQMGIQDTDVSSSGTTITDYGVGGRGIDWMQISNANGSQF